MPELPEVENIRLQLEKFLLGHRIEKIIINQPSVFTGDQSCAYATINAIRRFGKLLVIDLNNNYSIASHVKMTGQFIYRGPNLLEPPDISQKVAGGIPGKHTHVIFKLDNGGVLYFNDYRRFGWIKILPTQSIEKLHFVAKLGPEPLKNLDRGNFALILRKSKKPIKNLLMDQTKIAGIGNIYANDALWLSRINPEKIAKTLTLRERNKLFEALEAVLKIGIKKGGASENSYVRPDGTSGNYQKHSLVYNRAHEPCKTCGTKIEKFVLGGRGTYWCPKCQK